MSCLTKLPILSYQDFSKEFIVQEDASQTSIRAVLLQNLENGKENPILFCSFTLNSH